MRAACVQAKFTLASRHADKVHVVSPDWLYDCLSSRTRVDESLYHPRLLLTEKPADDSDVTAAADAMETSAGDISGVEPLDASRDDGKNAKTKEALAAMVSSRYLASVYLSTKINIKIKIAIRRIIKGCAVIDFSKCSVS